MRFLEAPWADQMVAGARRPPGGLSPRQTTTDKDVEAGMAD